MSDSRDAWKAKQEEEREEEEEDVDNNVRPSKELQSVILIYSRTTERKKMLSSSPLTSTKLCWPCPSPPTPKR